MGHKTLYICSFLATSKVNGEYRRKERRHRQPGTALEAKVFPLRCPKISWTYDPQTLKMEPQYIYSSSVNAVRCFFGSLHKGGGVTEQNSTKLCDTLESEPDLQMHGGFLPQNCGAINCLFCDGFQRDKTIP